MENIRLRAELARVTMECRVVGVSASGNRQHRARVNTVRAGDMTYIPANQGWLYLGRGPAWGETASGRRRRSLSADRDAGTGGAGCGELPAEQEVVDAARNWI